MPESTQKEILSFVLPDEASTELLGKRLAEAVLKHSKEITDRGLNIRLQGTLGAGKTTLTRALLRALGFTGRVRSRPLRWWKRILSGARHNHFDFYRFEPRKNLRKPASETVRRRTHDALRVAG